MTDDPQIDFGEWLASRQRPFSQIQALMEAMPHTEPVVSIEERLQAKEAIADAVETLTPEETWVFNATVIEGLSLRTVGKQLGVSKNTVASRRDEALRKLRELLKNNPSIQATLEGMSR